MITPNDIADVLESMVRGRFPDEPVYRDLTPHSFQRPSTLIVHDGGAAVPAVGCSAIELRQRYTLVTFVSVDEYHQSHLAALHARQMILLGLLLPCYIRVGDRAPKVAEEIELGGGYDFDSVTVTYGYTLNREDFEKIELPPDMGALHLSTEVRTYG